MVFICVKPSAPAPVLPTAPTITRGTVTSSSVQVSLSGGANIDTLIPQRRSAGGGAWTSLTAISPSAATYTFTGLSPSTSYDFRFLAENADGSAYSNTVTAETDAPSAFTPALMIDFNGLANEQAVFGTGSVENKRWDGVPGNNPYSGGYGMRATTAVAAPGKTSSCSMSIAAGSTGYPGDGGTGGGFGGWIHLTSRSLQVTQGQHLWWRMRIYFPSDWSWSRGDSGDQVKFMRLEHTASGQRIDLYVLNGNATFYNGETKVGGASVCAGYAFRNEFAARPNADTDFTTNRPLTAGAWHFVEQYLYAHSDGSQAIRRMWVDGHFVREQVGGEVKWIDAQGNVRTKTITAVPTLQNSGDAITMPFPFTYWNGGAPKNQTCYLQDMVFHTTPATLPSTDEFGNPFIGTVDL